MSNSLSFYLIRDTLVKPWLKYYFKHIEYRGLEHLRPNEPTLFVGNHQNAFVDAFLPIAKNPTPIWSLTRGDIFENPKVAKLLDNMCLIPVYRKRDGAGFQDKTMQTFERVKQLFKTENAHVLIFGEGNAKAESRLRPLTSGFARLAFDTVSDPEHGQPELLLQGVSVQYEQHIGFRKKAIVTIHPAIAMKDRLAHYQADPRKAIVALKKDMTALLKSALVSPPADDPLTPDQHMQLLWEYARKNELHFSRDFDQILQRHQELVKLPTPEKQVLLSQVNSTEPPKPTKKRYTNLLYAPLALFALPVLLPTILIAEKPVANFSDPQFFTSVRYATGMVVSRLLQFILLIALGIGLNWGIALAWALTLPITQRAFFKVYDELG